MTQSRRMSSSDECKNKEVLLFHKWLTSRLATHQDQRKNRWPPGLHTRQMGRSLSSVAPAVSSCSNLTPDSPGLSHTLTVLPALTGGALSQGCSDQLLTLSEAYGLCPGTIYSPSLWFCGSAPGWLCSQKHLLRSHSRCSSLCRQQSGPPRAQSVSARSSYPRQTHPVGSQENDKDHFHRENCHTQRDGLSSSQKRGKIKDQRLKSNNEKKMSTITIINNTNSLTSLQLVATVGIFQHCNQFGGCLFV